MIKAPSKRELSDSSAGMALLTDLSKRKSPVVAIDVSDALTASILKDYRDTFDAAWISSLANSSRLGFEDAYNLSPRDTMKLIQDIKIANPELGIIVDADNGGQSYKNSAYALRLLASLGTSLAFIENKTGVKFNSVDRRATKLHTLESRDVFAKKINAALESQKDTLVGIRLEEGTMSEDTKECVASALASVEYFMKNSRPDFFLFHWNKQSPEGPLQFARQYKELVSKLATNNPPLLACVATTYSKNITSKDLGVAGYKVVIYGNPLLRTQVGATRKTLEMIKNDGSLKNVDTIIPATVDVLKLFDVVALKDKRR